jgi:hypothetical protein
MLGVRGESARPPNEQLPLFSVVDPVVEQLATLDPNTMTPLQALDVLARLGTEARARTGRS